MYYDSNGTMNGKVGADNDDTDTDGKLSVYNAYHYTNKWLFILAIFNILMYAPSVWSFCSLCSISPILIIRSSPCMAILLHSLWWYLFLGITAWAFFKRLYLVIIPYILYLSYAVPVFIQGAIQNRNDIITGHFLSSTVVCYSYILLWLLGLITFIIMLFETNYRDLYSRLRKGFSE